MAVHAGQKKGREGRKSGQEDEGGSRRKREEGRGQEGVDGDRLYGWCEGGRRGVDEAREAERNTEDVKDT